MVRILILLTVILNVACKQEADDLVNTGGGQNGIPDIVIDCESGDHSCLDISDRFQAQKIQSQDQCESLKDWAPGDGVYFFASGALALQSVLFDDDGIHFINWDPDMFGNDELGQPVDIGAVDIINVSIYAENGDKCAFSLEEDAATYGWRFNEDFF